MEWWYAAEAGVWINLAHVTSIADDDDELCLISAQGFAGEDGDIADLASGLVLDGDDAAELRQWLVWRLPTENQRAHFPGGRK